MVSLLENVNYLVYIGGTILGSITVYFTVRDQLRKAKREQREWFESTVKNQTTAVVNQVRDEFKVVDERFKVTDVSMSKNKEDIADIENDIKTMTSDLKDICTKLSRHDYIVDEVLPEYKQLREEFYKFKSSVDANLFNNKSQRISYAQQSSDKGNRQNIDKDGSIQE